MLRGFTESLLVGLLVLWGAASAAPTAPAASLAPWQYPCGGPVSPRAGSAIRPLNTKPVKRLRQSFNIAHKLFTKKWPTVKGLYTGLENSDLLPPMDWLPKNEKASYEKELRDLGHPQKTEDTVRRVHAGLRQFLRTADTCLQSDTAKHSLPHTHQAQIRSFLQDIVAQLRKLQCDAETTAAESGVALGASAEEVADTTGCPYDLPSSDYLQAQLNDLAFFLYYRTFLDDWNKILAHAIQGARGKKKNVVRNKTRRNKNKQLQQQQQQQVAGVRRKRRQRKPAA